ncbi:MAG: GAF domain-containing sensor histidine kinase [Chloroflexi bacterium]|nr:GAF domain-containing sensor histidine kinase [Chloroflexota bacterium]
MATRSAGKPRKPEALHLPQENEKLRQRVEALEALQDVARTLSSELDLQRLLAQVMQAAAQVLGAEAGSILLVDQSTNELEFVLTQGGGGSQLLQRRMAIGTGLAGWVASQAKPAIVNDVTADPRFAREIGDSVSFQVKSLIAVPLASKGQVIGVLEVLNKASGEGFTEDDLQILNTLGAQAAVAIENARLYQALKEERDKILNTEEEVRKKLARDLHDGPTQALSAIAMKASLVRKQLEQEPAKAAVELRMLEALARRAAGDLRHMLFGLRPLMLETQGLIPTLQTYLARFQEMGEIAIQLDVSRFSCSLPHNSEVAVFGIIQEALNNILKHSRARNVQIIMEDTPKACRITIKDDGCGFDVASVERGYDQRSSFGLFNMRERAALINGKLALSSIPGQGTTITLTVPLR